MWLIWPAEEARWCLKSLLLAAWNNNRCSESCPHHGEVAGNGLLEGQDMLREVGWSFLFYLHASWTAPGTFQCLKLSSLQYKGTSGPGIQIIHSCSDILSSPHNSGNTFKCLPWDLPHLQGIDIPIKWSHSLPSLGVRVIPNIPGSWGTQSAGSEYCGGSWPTHGPLSGSLSGRIWHVKLSGMASPCHHPAAAPYHTPYYCCWTKGSGGQCSWLTCLYIATLWDPSRQAVDSNIGESTTIEYGFHFLNALFPQDVCPRMPVALRLCFPRLRPACGHSKFAWLTAAVTYDTYLISEVVAWTSRVICGAGQPIIGGGVVGTTRGCCGGWVHSLLDSQGCSHRYLGRGWPGSFYWCHWAAPSLLCYKYAPTAESVFRLELLEELTECCLALWQAHNCAGTKWLSRQLEDAMQLCCVNLWHHANCDHWGHKSPFWHGNQWAPYFHCPSPDYCALWVIYSYCRVWFGVVWTELFDSLYWKSETMRSKLLLYLFIVIKFIYL